MAVHPDSVIDTRMQNLFPNAYTKLTDMEEYCYDNSQQTFQYTGDTPGVDDYQPYFQSLSDAIVAWHNYSWPEEEIKDYIMALYQLIIMNSLNGAGQSILNSGVEATDIFTMDGYISNLLGYSLDYYDDMVEEEDQENPGTYTYSAPNLEADTSLVNGAPPIDAGLFSSKESSMVSVSTSEVYNRLFEEASSQSSLSREDMYNKIFIDYEFKAYFEEFGLNNLVPNVSY